MLRAVAMRLIIAKPNQAKVDTSVDTFWHGLVTIVLCTSRPLPKKKLNFDLDLLIGLKIKEVDKVQNLKGSAPMCL